MEMMARREEIQQISEEHQTKDDKPNSRKADLKEKLENDNEREGEKIIPMLEDNQLPAHMEEEGNDPNVPKIARAEGNLKESLKKPNQGSKRSPKLKPTVPQPFSLATDKRMSRERRSSVDFFSVTEKKMPRERRRSVDFKNSQPILSKCASLNIKTQTTSGLQGTAIPPRNSVSSTASAKTSSKNNTTTTENTDDKKIEQQQAGKELNKNKLQKSSTFKALPLPSFYHPKDIPSKPEIKKIPATRPNCPVLGQKNKSIVNREKLKPEEKRRTISNSAKETINKLLKGTKKALTGSKTKAAVAVSSA